MLEQWDEGRTSGRKLITMGRMGPTGGRTRPMRGRWDQGKEGGTNGRKLVTNGRNGTKGRKDETNGKRTGGSYRIKVGPMARRAYLWKESWTYDMKFRPTGGTLD
jgi:hypothetical protein